MTADEHITRAQEFAAGAEFYLERPDLGDHGVCTFEQYVSLAEAHATIALALWAGPPAHAPSPGPTGVPRPVETV